jgi:hypothetical protein
VLGSWRAVHALKGDFGFRAGEPSAYYGVAVNLEYVDHPPVCLVVDLARAVKITRWPAIQREAGDRLEADGRLLVSVREIDRDYARNLIAQSPSLLERDDGSEESEEDAIRRLQRFAHVRAWTKVQIDMLDAEAGVAIRLPDTPDWA